MLQLDEWVLCRIYNKKGTLEKHYNVDQESVQFSDSEEQKPNVNKGNITPGGQPRTNGYTNFDTPKLHTYSSSSEHVFSPEFKEVQSDPKWNELETPLGFQLMNYMDGFQDDPFSSQMQYNDMFFWSSV